MPNPYWCFGTATTPWWEGIGGTPVARGVRHVCSVVWCDVPGGSTGGEGGACLLHLPSRLVIHTRQLHSAVHTVHAVQPCQCSTALSMQYRTTSSFKCNCPPLTLLSASRHSHSLHLPAPPASFTYSFPTLTLPPPPAVWVKVVDLQQDERGPKVGSCIFSAAVRSAEWAACMSYLIHRCTAL